MLPLSLNILIFEEIYHSPNLRNNYGELYRKREICQTYFAKNVKQKVGLGV